jgi:hypothetical protein
VEDRTSEASPEVIHGRARHVVSGGGVREEIRRIEP